MNPRLVCRIVGASLLLAGIGTTESGEEAPAKLSPSRDVAAVAASRARLHRQIDRAKVDDDLHNACIALTAVGDSTSVPHLIKALRLFPDGELKPGEGMICTQAHCVEALERITGAKVGVSYSSWRRWYEETGGDKASPAPPK